MSKNFELMQEAGVALELPATVTATPKSGFFVRKKEASVRANALDLSKLVREESMKLVQAVFQSGKEGAPRVVVFAGIDAGNGCSGICAQAAEFLAGHNLGSVCLVDANLHAPVLPDLFGVTNHFGLTDALRKQGAIRDFSKQLRGENLWLLSSGSLASDASVLLSSDTMKERIAELRKAFDFVLIDVPELSRYSDGIALGQLADGVVLVLEANSTRREAAAKVTDGLRAANIKILGAVLNKRTYPIPEPLYRIL